MRLLVVLVVVAPETERPDHERQRQALADESHEDHGEGDDDDRLACRQRVSGQRDRKRERCREGDHAPHASPRKDERLSESGAALIVRQKLANTHPDHPEGADGDERDAHEDADRGELEECPAIHLSGNRRDLEPDGEKHDAVQKEDQALPDRAAGEARFGAHDLRRPPADEESRGHRGQDAGDTERFRREVRRVGREQRDGDLDGRIGDASTYPHRDPAHDESDEDAAERHKYEARERPDHGNGRGRRSRADRRPVDRERGRVIEEALALEDADDPARDREPLRYRGRRHRVGRRDDGPERDGEWPRHAGHERHRGCRDHAHARGNETDGEQADVLEIRAEVADRSEERTHIEDRRQDDEEDDLRVELEWGDSRNESDDEPAEQKEHWIGHADPARNGHEHGNDHEEREEELSRFQSCTPPFVMGSGSRTRRRSFSGMTFSASAMSMSGRRSASALFTSAAAFA